MPSASALVTRLLPRASLNALVSASGPTLRSRRIRRASDSTAAREISRCSVATNASPSESARFSASASTRANAPESAGWLTDEPLADGSLAIAPCAAASTTVGSPPTAADQRCHGVARHHQQGVQEMHRLGVGIAGGESVAQSGRNRVAALGGQLVGVHTGPSSVLRTELSLLGSTLFAKRLFRLSGLGSTLPTRSPGFGAISSGAAFARLPALEDAGRGRSELRLVPRLRPVNARSTRLGGFAPSRHGADPPGWRTHRGHTDGTPTGGEHTDGGGHTDAGRTHQAG